MVQEITPSSSPTLEKVKECFAQLRQNRRGREPIPVEAKQEYFTLSY